MLKNRRFCWFQRLINIQNLKKREKTFIMFSRVDNATFQAIFNTNRKHFERFNTTLI